MINPKLTQALYSPDSQVRKRAVTALAKTGDPEALPYLAKVVKTDRDPTVRELARKAGRYLQQQTQTIPTVTETETTEQIQPEQRALFAWLAVMVVFMAAVGMLVVVFALDWIAAAGQSRTAFDIALGANADGSADRSLTQLSVLILLIIAGLQLLWSLIVILRRRAPGHEYGLQAMGFGLLALVPFILFYQDLADEAALWPDGIDSALGLFAGGYWVGLGVVGLLVVFGLFAFISARRRGV